MSHITSLPIEIQSSILSLLPLVSQLELPYVCKLWRTLLLEPQLRTTRYKAFSGTHRTASLSVHASNKNIVRIHQILYNHFGCATGYGRETVFRLAGGDGLLESIEYHPACSFAGFVMAASDTPHAPVGKRKLVRGQRCFQDHDAPWDIDAIRPRFHVNPISLAHPFFDDPAFKFPQVARDSGESDVVAITVMPVFNHEDTRLRLNRPLLVSKTITIRELAEEVMELLTGLDWTDLDRDEGAILDTSNLMGRIRLHFIKHPSGSQTENGLPVLRVDWDTGAWM
ncbi:hypothetical protein TWF730_001574 [Orbilia blumenaviensis]|uniref:F-box domain-containing protein n=1 Tax=Orbilia blumenaviensis TaxID=1796055 RepID=A0AAV9UI27_9PEZI